MSTNLDRMSVDAPSEREPVIVMHRTFDAPRALVWEALTDPKQVAKWYGGHGFENPVCEMDVRPGGRWRHVMKTPDGTEYPMEYVFVEVVKPERLVWKDAEPRTRVGGHVSPMITVTLEEAGTKTKWKLVARFASLAERDVAIEMGFTRVLSQGAEKFNEIVTAH